MGSEKLGRPDGYWSMSEEERHSADVARAQNQGEIDAAEGRPNKVSVGVFDLAGDYDLDDEDCRDGYDKGHDNTVSQSRVICTYFYQKGQLRRKVWRADMAFTQAHISSVTIRGYHYWGIPYVKLMRRSQLAERIMFPLVKWRAEELAYQMGALPCSNFKGKLVRIFGEPLCWLLGCLVSQKDWRALSEGQKVA